MSRRGRGIHDRVVSMPFRVVASTEVPKTASGVTVTELELQPANLGTRIAGIRTSFEYYRVKDLHLRVYSSVVGPVHYDSDILNVTLGTMGAHMAVAYEPSDTTRTGVPTGLNGMAQAAEFAAGNVRNTLDVRVPRATLMGAPLKWWNTTTTGSPTETLVQGLIWTYASNMNVNEAAVADIVLVVVAGTIEFKGMIDPALSLDTKLKYGIADEDKTSETGSVEVVPRDDSLTRHDSSIRNALDERTSFRARLGVAVKQEVSSTPNREQRVTVSAGPSPAFV